MTTPITVLISTRDRARALARSLPTVLRSIDRASQLTELVVVNNGSTDLTNNVLHALTVGRGNVRLMTEGPPKAAALNRALALLDCGAVLFTDDDVHVPLTWVDDMSRPILDGTADVVAGAIRLAPHLDRP